MAQPETVSLRFSPDILARLGEELNPNLDQGILELAKNSYDACATTCTIEYSESGSGRILIEDNGLGMDADQIKAGWLLIGHSEKGRAENPCGRTPAGSKGLGRLAALRMGATVEMRSVPAHDLLQQHVVKITWADYAGKETVEEVPLQIETKKLAQAAPHSGTTIEIRDLKQKISAREADRLAKGLLLMANPFESGKGFKIRLNLPQFATAQKKLKNGYFGDADYHLKSSLNAEGKLTAQVLDWRGEIVWDAAEQDSGFPQRTYSAPPFDFDLWVFRWNKETFIERSATMAEAKAWVKEFGGVHLYINGVRMGSDSGLTRDWLGMNFLRVKDPQMRPSTDSAIGRVVVTDAKGLLVQTSNRTEVIDSTAFSDLKAACIAGMEWMARKRIDLRDKLAEKERAATKKEANEARAGVDAAVAGLPKAARTKVQKAVLEYAAAQEKERARLLEEVGLLRGTTTAGIAASFFAHEVRHPLGVLRRGLARIKKRIQTAVSAKQYRSDFQEQLERCNRQLGYIEAHAGISLSLVAKKRRRAHVIEVHDHIRNTVQEIEARFRERDCEIELQLDSSKARILSSESILDSILLNPMLNSLKAFENSSIESRKIQIRTTLSEGRLRVAISDNGPGIDPAIIKDIWQSGVSSYEDGTGLGLTIVRDCVKDLGGTVYAMAVGPLGGAEVGFELPVLTGEKK